MLKKTIGWILFILSYPLIFVGATLFVVNLLLFSMSLSAKSTADFITPLVMAGVGYVCRLVGQRLQRISY